MVFLNRSWQALTPAMSVSVYFSQPTHALPLNRHAAYHISRWFRTKRKKSIHGRCITSRRMETICHHQEESTITSSSELSSWNECDPLLFIDFSSVRRQWSLSHFLRSDIWQKKWYKFKSGLSWICHFAFESDCGRIRLSFFARIRMQIPTEKTDEQICPISTMA